MTSSAPNVDPRAVEVSVSDDELVVVLADARRIAVRAGRLAAPHSHARRIRSIGDRGRGPWEAPRVASRRYEPHSSSARVAETLPDSESVNEALCALLRVAAWINVRPVDTRFIQPGSPWQNGHDESFNGVLRDGCLNRWGFSSVREARLVVESWRREYDEERPHGALDQITPAAHTAGVGQEQREAG